MHPKAAFLALHGATVFINPDDQRSARQRIYRVSKEVETRGAILGFVFNSWVYTHWAEEIFPQVEVGWDTLPAGALDKLPWPQIVKFCNHLLGETT